MLLIAEQGYEIILIFLNGLRIYFKRIFFQKRLQKELQNLIESPPEGVKVGSETAEGSDMST